MNYDDDVVCVEDTTFYYNTTTDYYRLLSTMHGLLCAMHEYSCEPVRTVKRNIHYYQEDPRSLRNKEKDLV